MISYLHDAIRSGRIIEVRINRVQCYKWHAHMYPILQNVNIPKETSDLNLLWAGWLGDKGSAVERGEISWQT